MAKQRDSIPKATRESVLKEFNHRCAICGSDRPHLHHINENPANNEFLNLIPLCPNHHLSDQHDASNAVPQAKLYFFRRHKHRYILKPQFNPVFRRIAFLNIISETDDVKFLEPKALELISLVRNLSMGEFYAGELQKLLKPPSGNIAVVLGDAESEMHAQIFHQKRAQKYREQLRQAIPEVERLIVEMLDYQNWP
jgi:hypothetical protein